MEKYQGNGFMTKLLKFAEQEAQNVFGAETIRISTQWGSQLESDEESNKEAIDFYLKRGYADEGERIKREGEWKGKSPYYSIILVKHFKDKIKN
jgi:GNAT superfamily N-acetyltransferase